MGRLVTLVAVVFSLLGLVPVQAGSDKVAERNKSGVELLKQGKADKAIPEFKKAIELDPDNASVHLNLAYAYDLQGSVEEAIGEYQWAIELGPENHLAHNNLGVLYDKKGLYDEAIGEFDKALQIEPSDSNTLKNLENSKNNKAVIAKRQNQIAEAQKEVQDRPNSPNASYKLARLYALDGKRDEAIEWLDKALKLGFNDLAYLKADTALEGLRDDPVFNSLLDPR